jgi:hypothetical protein
VDIPPEEVMNRVQSLLERPQDHIKGQIIDEHITLDIVGEEVHYWSPQLNFRVEPDEYDATKTTVAGYVGPRPAVWTLFVFIYFGVGVAGFFIATYGFIKTTLGDHSNLMFALPIAIGFMLTAFSVGKYGEKLAKEQTDYLKAFVRDATLAKS